MFKKIWHRITQSLCYRYTLLMIGKASNEMSEEFDEIARGFSNNSGDSRSEQGDFDTLWDGIEVLWRAMYPGTVLIKGLLIAEFTDGEDKALRYVSSPDTAEWDVLGMLKSIELGLTANNLNLAMQDFEFGDDEDGE